MTQAQQRRELRRELDEMARQAERTNAELQRAIRSVAEAMTTQRRILRGLRALQALLEGGEGST